MNFDLLIFDCDGTLVDSEYLNNLATVKILAQEGLPQYDLAYAFENFVGLRLTTILETIAHETGHVFPDTMSQRYTALVDKLTPQYLKPIDGAANFVAIAAPRMKICVASNGQRDNVLHSLEWTGVKKHFPDDHIFTAAQVENGKPAPDIFLLAAKTMGAEPSRCVVIEDSVPGVAGAFAAGMHIIGFVNAHQDIKLYGERLKAAGAEQVFSSFIHIKNYLFP